MREDDKLPEENAAPAPGKSDHDTGREDSRLICRFSLLIALVFVVTALEDGSYRTPWPAAILVLAGALALCRWLWNKNKS